MCDDPAEGGKRCANHTRPRFEKALAEVRAARTFDRPKVRLNLRSETGDNFMITVLNHASTASGKKDVEAAIEEFRTSQRDPQTTQQLMTGLREGIKKAQVDAEVRQTVRTARVRQQRTDTSSSSELKVSKKAVDDPTKSLAHVYPDIASEMDPTLNGGIGPEQITPYQNAQVTFRCEKAGHITSQRLNNRTNRAREGRATRCTACQTGRQKSLEDLQDTLAEFTKSVGDDPAAWESLSPAMRHAIMTRTGMLSAQRDDFERATALSMIHGDLTLQEVVAARNVEDIEGSVNDSLSDDSETSDLDGTVSSPAVTDAPVTMENRVDRIMASSGIAKMVADDELLVSAIVHENVEQLWNEVHDYPDEVDALVARVQAGADTDPYRARVAREFTTELDKVKATPLPATYESKRVRPDGTVEEMVPLLSQRRFAVRVEEDRRVMNWSGTGAGKTLSAVLSMQQVGAEESLVVCPASVMRQWKAQIEAADPQAEVMLRLPSADDDLEETGMGRRRVWITSYETFSNTKVNPAETEARINRIASRVDAVILDEIHLAKSSDQNTASARSGVLRGFIDKAGTANPDLVVIGMSATPVVTDLSEAKSLLRMGMGEDPKGFRTEPTAKNAANAYQHLSSVGTRWKPTYRTSLTRNEVMVDVSAKLPQIMARIERMRKREGEVGTGSQSGKSIHPAIMERALLPEKMPKIVESVRQAKGPVIVYSEYTTGVVDPIRDELRRQGFTAERFTGDESLEERAELVRKFQSGEVQVLVGSRPIATGVDGLQRVCKKMVVAVPSWTAAQDDQMVGRLQRTGQTEDVSVDYIMTEAKVGDLSWSFCKGRMARIRFRRSLADAAVDGIMSDGQLAADTKSTNGVLDALRKLTDDMNDDLAQAA